MDTEPLEEIDEAARTEEAEKQAQALATARKLALAHKFDEAKREIEPWLHRPESDPNDLIREASEPRQLANAIEKARAVHDPASVVGLKPVSKCRGGLPPRVLWMDARFGGIVLREGETAVLSGAGGAGKSFVTLALAVAAARPEDEEYGTACGFHVRKGPVVVLSYEDDPRTVAWRCGLIVSTMARPDAPPDRVFVIDDPDPLMVAEYDVPGKVAEAPAWPWLWAAVRSVSPSIVIVDPASAALAGVNQNDGATVRRFLRALGQEGKNGGFGVLVVAHSTKGARFGQADVGPHAVAGSAQWMDTSRGVLFMRGQGPGRASIECVKSNHGPAHWAVELEADLRTRANKPERFAGWKKRSRYDPEEWKKLNDAREQAAKAARKKRGAQEVTAPIPDTMPEVTDIHGLAE